MIEEQDLPTDLPVVSPEQSDDSQRHLAELHEDVDFLIHEIRTPLTAIISSAEFVMEEPLSPKEKGLLDTIHREARRINDLLADFHQLNQKRAESWLSEMTFSTVRVPDLLDDAANRFRNASQRHTIRLYLAPNLAPVHGDRMKLDLVVRNLMANAIKYSPNGGTIFLSAWEEGDGVVVCVRDQGIGISERDQARIFDRKFRIDHSETHKPHGSGLGLAIVDRIVKKHGGSLRVESEIGKGSAFFFILPKSD